jgi:hypothetical protein
MLNPGSGEGRSDFADQEACKLIKAFRDGSGSLEKIFEHQRRDMPRWGKGRFLPFYIGRLGLPLNELAFANVAWCSTSGNKYPAQMLNDCFSRHTAKLLTVLKPDVVVLSGVRIYKFSDKIEKLLPGVQMRRAYHYANRRGKGWY